MRRIKLLAKWNRGLKSPCSAFTYAIVLVIMAVSLLSTPAVVYADTPDPDSTPTVVGKNVYRNLLETGDRLFVIYANIPYASLPDTPVTATFIWRLIDTDNVTELGQTIGYTYNDSGYGYNVYSLYFSAADNLTWGSSYILRLSGNPSVFDTPPEYNFTFTASDYTSSSTQADNRAELAARILAIGTDLNLQWGLTSSFYLTTEGETGTVLSAFGQAFFRGAVRGLQGMAPSLFPLTFLSVDATPRWAYGESTNYTTSLENQHAGTWVDTAKAAGQALWGAGFDLTSTLIVLAICGIVLFGNISLTSDSWSGLMDVYLVVILFSRIGFVPLGFAGLIAAMAWFYVSARLWGIFR